MNDWCCLTTAIIREFLFHSWVSKLRQKHNLFVFFSHPNIFVLTVSIYIIKSTSKIHPPATSSVTGSSGWTNLPSKQPFLKLWHRFTDALLDGDVVTAGYSELIVMVKSPVWDVLSFVTWFNILLEVAVRRWVICGCGHKGMSTNKSQVGVVFHQCSVDTEGSKVCQ